LLSLLLSLLFFSSQALAYDGDGNWSIRGLGITQCSDFISAPTFKKVWYKRWMLGYLTGANQFKKGETDYVNNLFRKNGDEVVRESLQKTP